MYFHINVGSILCGYVFTHVQAYMCVFARGGQRLTDTECLP